MSEIVFITSRSNTLRSEGGREGDMEGGREEGRGSGTAWWEVSRVLRDESADHWHCTPVAVAPRVKDNVEV